MTVVAPDDVRSLADHIGAVIDALTELSRQHDKGRPTVSGAFASLQAMCARRRALPPAVVVNLAPRPADVLDLAVTALSDIELMMRGRGR